MRGESSKPGGERGPAAERNRTDDTGESQGIDQSVETDESAETDQSDDEADARPPTGIEQELEEIRPSTVIKRELDRLAEKTNLRLGFAYTTLFQQASAGAGERWGAAGDVDLLAKWTAIGAGTPDTGILAFAAEYRHQIGHQPPAALGGEIGALTSTTNGFGERPVIVKELYWDQRLFDDRVRFGVGRIDPENLFGGHRLQSANLFFLNKAFSSNPAVAFPGAGLAAAGAVRPTTWSFISGGIADANGSATTSNFEGFFREHEYLLFSEAGLTPEIDGLGRGRYRLALWQIDARRDARRGSDSGVTLSLDQELGESLTVFARYGTADADVTRIDHSVQAGVGIKGFPSGEHMLGVAGSWSSPADDSLRDEKVFEVFERWQLTPAVQFTLGVQAIVDPSNAPGDDILGVFSLRLRVSF